MDFQPKGIIPAMVTPTDEWGNLKEQPLRRLTNYLIDGGVHGVFPVGSQGEFYALTPEVKKRVMEIVIEETNGRVPVYVGTGAVTTREAIELTKMAKAAGASAVSVLTPFFVTPNDQELYNHYKLIAEAVPDMPILLYGNKDRTGVGLSPDLVVRLSKIDNIVGMKDSSGDMTVTAEYIRRTDSSFNVLMGRDTLIYSALVHGGKGSITATANAAPKLVVEIYEAFVAGDLKRSLEAQYRLAPLRLAFGWGTFPVVIKEALNLMGFEVGSAILPVGPLPEQKREDLRRVLVEMGVLA
ncbi:MAG: 4-hydroxy-tetrahydrodipicolinate synthase [Chitinophagales bacterium]